MSLFGASNTKLFKIDSELQITITRILIFKEFVRYPIIATSTTTVMYLSINRTHITTNNASIGAKRRPHQLNLPLAAPIIKTLLDVGL